MTMPIRENVEPVRILVIVGTLIAGLQGRHQYQAQVILAKLNTDIEIRQHQYYPALVVKALIQQCRDRPRAFVSLIS